VDVSKERLLTLLELLQVRRRMSGEEIADRLEVTPRTVRRYILGLQEMGIPVEAERGRTGGYRMRPGFKLPPLMFTNEEAFAVVLGLLAVQRLGLASSGLAVQGALAKLDRVLPEALRDSLRAAQETVHLGLAGRSGEGGQAGGDTVLTVTTAARDRLRLRIRYRSAQGVETERLVDPYGVAFHTGHWYAAAFDHLRHDLRTFRLDRLLETEVTRESFQRPEGFDPGLEVQRSIAAVRYPWNATVLLHVPLERAQSLVGPTVGTLEAAGRRRTRLHLGADDLEWITHYVAGLGVPFSVISPPQLRDTLRREAARLAACAEEGAEG
jgi:predicted DNA-binding transcriptional regulator YafY